MRVTAPLFLPTAVTQRLRFGFWGMPSIPSATLLALLALLAQPGASSASEYVDLGNGLGCNTSAEVSL